MYDYLDKILKKLVREIYRRFKKYRTLKFDELNILQSTQELYSDLAEINFRAFLDIARYYYRREAIGDAFSEDMLLKILRTPSRVMKYSYDSELIRKRDRLMEALLATNGATREIDKSMRYWTQMTGWFAVEVADMATAQARVDNEVDFVIWRSEHDEKTCSVCRRLDGHLYHLFDVPPKPHPNCRCWTEIVT